LGDYEGRARLARLISPRHTLCRRLRLSDRRTRRPSPLRTRFLPAARAICHSRGLPTQRRRRSGPNGTFPTRSRRCADGLSSHSPEPSRDFLAAMHRSASRPEFLTTDAVRLEHFPTRRNRRVRDSGDIRWLRTGRAARRLGQRAVIERSAALRNRALSL
jgi:hypothetical protein